MASTLQQIAHELNLSKATVSRVLSGKGTELVAARTRKRVLQMSERMGFRPNPVARALATGKTNAIGVLTYGIFPAYYSETLSRLQEIIHDAGFHVQLHETLGMEPSPDKLRQLTAWPVDGFLAFDVPASMAALRAAGVSTPMVCMGTNVPRDDSVDRVWIDAYPAVYEALSEMADAGVKRLAAVINPAGNENDARVCAYERVIEERGIPREYIVAPPGRTDSDTSATMALRSEFLRRRRAWSRSLVCDHVRAHGCPDALFCPTDDIAVGALWGLLDAGYVVPKDALLLGFDGTEDGLYQYTELSTVAIPEEALCREAWRLLRERMETPDAPPRQVILQARPVRRASSVRGGPQRDPHAPLAPAPAKDG